MRGNLTQKRIAFFFFLGVSFLLILVCNFLTPLLTDDYSYGLVARSAKSLGGLLAQEARHYMFWNGRSVAHFLLRLTLVAPPAVFKILNSFVFVLLTLLLYGNVTERRAYDLRLLTAVTLLLWFGGVSFAETVLWQTGACNYLWGATIILGFVTLFRYLLKKVSVTQKGARSALLAAGMFLFGVLAGWCNENTSGGGLILTAGTLFLDRRRRQDRRIAPWALAGLAGQLAGLIAMVAAPGNRARAALLEPEAFSGLVGLFARFQKITLALGENLFPWIALFLFLLVLNLCQGKKPADLAEPLLFAFAALATSYALILSPPTQLRAHFGAEIFLFVAIAQLYDRVGEDAALIAAAKRAAVVIGAAWFFFFYMENTTNLGRLWRESAERTDYIEAQIAEGNTERICVSQLRPGFDTVFSTAYASDLTEDPDYWINEMVAKYYQIDELIALPREEWEKLLTADRQP